MQRDKVEHPSLTALSTLLLTQIAASASIASPVFSSGFSSLTRIPSAGRSEWFPQSKVRTRTLSFA